MPSVRCALCNRLLMIDRKSLETTEGGTRPIICALCEALPDERKRLRDEAMTRDLLRESEAPMRVMETARAGKPRG